MDYAIASREEEKDTSDENDLTVITSAVIS